MRPRRSCLIAALAMPLTASWASASDFCIVQKSADGYVALRAKPSSGGELIVRTKPGEVVIIQKSASGDQIVSGSWLRVMHFPDTVPPQASDPAYKRGKVGWMHKRLINDCG